MEKSCEKLPKNCPSSTCSSCVPSSWNDGEHDGRGVARELELLELQLYELTHEQKNSTRRLDDRILRVRTRTTVLGTLARVGIPTMHIVRSSYSCTDSVDRSPNLRAAGLARGMITVLQ